MFGANPFGFDPSKMDPKALLELSNLVRELPPAHLIKMQTLMHNQMAGFDVQKEMVEFEQNLPVGFREKLMGIMLRGGVPAQTVEPESASLVAESPAVSAESSESMLTSAEMSVRDARLTVLRAVAEGSMDPDDALVALWPNG